MFIIRPLEKKDLAVAAVICAHAMQENPIHVRVFGKALTVRKRRLKRFFPGLLAYVYRKGSIYGAFTEQGLVGVLGMLPPKHCKPSVYDFVRLLPTLLTSSSPIGTVRLAVWLSTWARIDPVVPHWHLGPLAVDPAWQKHGIGTQLMELACNKGSATNIYLETDKLSNVELYNKFGFSILATPSILGASSWVMMRPA